MLSSVLDTPSRLCFLHASRSLSKRVGERSWASLLLLALSSLNEQILGADAHGSSELSLVLLRPQKSISMRHHAYLLKETLSTRKSSGPDLIMAYLGPCLRLCTVESELQEIRRDAAAKRSQVLTRTLSLTSFHANQDTGIRILTFCTFGLPSKDAEAFRSIDRLKIQDEESTLKYVSLLWSFGLSLCVAVRFDFQCL